MKTANTIENNYRAFLSLIVAEGFLRISQIRVWTFDTKMNLI